MINPKNKYTDMQQNQYDNDAKKWTVSNRDPVVGSFDAHNAWKDYDILFKNIDAHGKIALDFGCGPGRNIVKFSNLFDRIDGVDISDINLKNAELWVQQNGIKIPSLYKNNGVDIAEVPSSHYDVVFSTICMQHICVHEIRYSLFSEFFRVLKDNGWISIQMGFGTSHPRTVGYFDNYYDAPGTNSMCDVRIENPQNLEDDLSKIGFKNFSFEIRPVGPGDGHSNWIFFKAQKA